MIFNAETHYGMQIMLAGWMTFPGISVVTPLGMVKPRDSLQPIYRYAIRNKPVPLMIRIGSMKSSMMGFGRSQSLSMDIAGFSRANAISSMD